MNNPTLGMYTSLIYNVYVATSVTTQGRELTSSATMFFESFLADNVKFGSLNQVVEFINHIHNEYPTWEFDDREWIDDFYTLTPEDVFAKLIMDTGYRWIPNQDEMEIIWDIVQNLDRRTLVRVWYKNNLYEFVENTKIFELVRTMLKKLDKPIMFAGDIPPEISDDIVLFANLLKEFVYYRYMIPDRIDRTNNMIKSVICVTDTDSCILSLDAWFRYVSQKISGEEFKIMNSLGSPIEFFDWSEEDEISGKDKFWKQPIQFFPVKYDYNFATDELVEMKHRDNPTKNIGEDNMRVSIINIMTYCIDKFINDYMEKLCINNNSFGPKYDRKCRILMKNEFLMRRMLMTTAKKNYASLIEVQEGNLIPENAQLAITGIEALAKSTKSKKTRDALKKILLEDIMRADQIDQMRVIKDIAVLEKSIILSLQNGSKEYYKPVTIKSQGSYDDPMRIQGIKASYAWNLIKSKDLPAIDLETRNGIDIAKVIINRATVEKIKDTYPEIYENMLNALDQDAFKTVNKKTQKVISNSIDAIAIPMDVNVPDWLLEFIDYQTLVNDNIGGFPYQSIGIVSRKGINYTNIVEL